MQYKQINTEDIPARTLELADRALAASASFLNLDVDSLPDLKFFIPDEPLNHSDVEQINFRVQPMTAPANLKGASLSGNHILNPEIWVNAELTDTELITTIGHELYHHFEYLTGFEVDENEAERFGRKLLLSFQQPKTSGWQEIVDQYGFSRMVYRPPA